MENEEKICKNCIFWNCPSRYECDNDDFFQCRRYAPMSFFVVERHSEEERNHPINYKRLIPETHALSFCGDFKSKNT